ARAIAGLLFEELRETTVGQRLAAGLARRAVLERLRRERHFPDLVAAHRARLAGAAVHPQARLLLALEPGRRQARRSLERVLEDRDDGGVKALDLFVREAVGRLEGREARRMEGLVR